ncbi:MAG: Gfo/Idh/MocA family oxidoreductase, partial [Verrucomicrobiae bacterium]|nr:Gfo/Idh/MocA family oxidoreductase [Verrucomicrobiae bacterium]
MLTPIQLKGSTGIHRRHFLRSATLLTGTAVFAGPALLRGQNLNNKLNVAVVGVGGRGGANMAEVAKTENIVALCDVNEKNLGAAEKKFPQAKRYIDFRRLFDDAKSFDAVVCSTTEHTHAPVV